MSRHLLLACLALIGCFPLGIVALLMSSQVKQALARGDVTAARRASRQVLYWSLLGIAIGGVVIATQARR